MIRRFRQVLPDTWIVLLFITCYVCALGTELLGEWRYGQRAPLGGIALAYLCFCLGLWRGWAFHPALNAQYRRWLQTVPWVRGKPLPLGPAWLDWPDAIVLLGFVGLAAFEPGFAPSRVVTTYLAGYLAISSFFLWITGEWAFGYAVAFGLGLMIWIWALAWAAAAAAVAVYAVAYVGLWRSLTRFPWHLPSLEIDLSDHPAQAGTRLSASSLGWPYEYLSPKWSESWLAAHDPVLFSLLVGWLFYAIGTLAPDQAAMDICRGAQGMVVGIAAVCRCACWCGPYRPPISLLTRLRTGRLIIPGYDYALGAPLLAVLVGIVLPAILTSLRPDLAAWQPLFTTGALLLGLNLGPSYKTWCLTGNCRIAPFRSNQFVRVG